MTQQGGGQAGAGFPVGGALAGTLPNPSLSGAGIPADLGYVEITAAQTGISASAMTDITGLVLTVTVGTRALWLEVWVALFDGLSTGGNRAIGQIFDVTGASIVAQGYALNSAGNSGSLYIARRMSPAAGSRTYKVQGQGDSVSTPRWFASSSSPSWFRIREV